MRTSFFPLAVLLVCGVLFAVSAPTAQSAPSQQSGPLSVTVVTDKAGYNRGEPIRFVISVMNTTSSSTSVTMPTGQDYDLFIRTLDGSEVWRWSRDRLFTQAVRNVTFEADQTRTFSEIWDQHTSTGQQVGPGSYVVVGAYMSSPEVRSSLFGFNIETPASTITPTTTPTATATATTTPPRNQWLNRPPSGPDAVPACPTQGQWLLLYWGGADSTSIAEASAGCTTIVLLTFPPQYVCGDGTRATEAGRCPEADLYWVNRSGRWLGYSKVSPDASDAWNVLRGEAHFARGRP